MAHARLVSLKSVPVLGVHHEVGLQASGLDVVGDDGVSGSSCRACQGTCCAIVESSPLAFRLLIYTLHARLHALDSLCFKVGILITGACAYSASPTLSTCQGFSLSFAKSAQRLALAAKAGYAEIVVWFYKLSA